MKSKKLIVPMAAGLVLAFGLAGCAHNNVADSGKSMAPKTSPSAIETSAAPAGDEKQGAVKANTRPEGCGLQEQAGPQASFGPFEVGIHYFQPGQMFDNPESDMKMGSYKDSQMHLEMDTKANAFGTNWGYSVDETPSDLRVFYQLSNSEGNVIAHGMMMQMNAIDGSHYGTNLPKETIKGPGDYSLKITIYPPKNYALHQDYITGVPARGWFKPLTVVMPWKLTQENLDIVKKNTVDDPMNPSEKCKAYPVKMYEDPAAQKAMEKAEAEKPLPMMH